MERDKKKALKTTVFNAFFILAVFQKLKKHVVPLFFEWYGLTITFNCCQGYILV